METCSDLYFRSDIRKDVCLVCACVCLSSCTDIDSICMYVYICINVNTYLCRMLTMCVDFCIYIYTHVNVKIYLRRMLYSGCAYVENVCRHLYIHIDRCKCKDISMLYVV